MILVKTQETDFICKARIVEVLQQDVFFVSRKNMAVYDDSGDINSTQLDTSRKRKSISRSCGTTEASSTEIIK